MNDEDAKALGMRAKALPGFSWQPRMMNGRTELYALAVLAEDGEVPWVLWEPEESWSGFKDEWDGFREDDWPDFRDPPTMGWLLEQVREAWGDPRAYVEPNGLDGWALCVTIGRRRCIVETAAATEAGALVRTLEEAAKK